MVVLRAFLIAVVTLMTILGPGAAAERAAQRANCEPLSLHAVEVDTIGLDFANEARLLYCQVAASILPDGWTPATRLPGLQPFTTHQERVASTSVSPRERPPRRI